MPGSIEAEEAEHAKADYEAAHAAAAALEQAKTKALADAERDPDVVEAREKLEKLRAVS